MRLWTIHPQHLDAKGLVALWREALLAQAVVLGRTRGYRNHPQLERFLATPEPAAALASYLLEVHREATRRGYSFDATKIGRKRFPSTLAETEGQLLYEWKHLQGKLERRAPEVLLSQNKIKTPKQHPLFHIIAGEVRPWERQQ